MSDINEIANYDEIGIDELTEIIKSSDLSKETTATLFEKCGKHFKIEFDTSYANIESNISENSNDELLKVYELIDSIKKPNIDFDKFLSLCDIPSSHPLVTSNTIRTINKNSFLEEISENIKDWKNSGKSLSYSIRKFRMSPEGRQCITRKTKLDITDELLQQFISSFHVSERAEIFTRIEKYIESGWFEKDNPFHEYYADSSKKQQAIDSLKENMGKRFFEASVNKTQYGLYYEYNLVLHKDKSLRSNIFNIALGGVKDYCIESVDGKKIYLGDVTTDETGYGNGFTWLSTAKAISNYKKENPDVKINYSVSLMSLFYDTEVTENSIKTKFIEKFNEHTQLNVAQWHLLQYLAVLDRDTQDFNFDIKDLINDTTLHFFGTESEGYCNTVLKLNKEDFVKQVFHDFKSIIENITEKGYIINAQGMKTNVESIPIHLLVSAVKGFEIVVNSDEKLIAEYCELKEPVDKLKKLIVNAGHIKKELINLSQRLSHPDDISNSFLEENEIFVSHKKQVERDKENRLELQEKNKEIIGDIITSYQKFVSTLFSDVSPIINIQKESWSKNYTTPMNSIINGLSVLNESTHLKKWIYYNKQTIEKRDNPIKDIIYNVAKSMNKSYEKIEFIENIDKCLKEIDKHFENINLFGDRIFTTKNRVNTQQNYTLYGKFLYHQLGAKTHAQGGELENKFYENLKNNTQENLLDLKEKLHAYKTINLALDQNQNQNKKLKP